MNESKEEVEEYFLVAVQKEVKRYLSMRCWSRERCSFSLLISSLLILVISLFLSMYLPTPTALLSSDL